MMSYDNRAREQMSDQDDDNGDDAKSCRTSEDCRKQNHSEIEKRRRDKMNALLRELAQLLQGGSSSSQRGKSDKLGVLRRAVARVREAKELRAELSRGSCSSAVASAEPAGTLWRPSETDVQALGRRVPEQCFMFAVGCTRGKILYASAAVTGVLHYKLSELVGHCWFDVLHPKDVSKVKEQLSALDFAEAKAAYAENFRVFCPGSRRAFCCRMRLNTSTNTEDDVDAATADPRQPFEERRFVALQCYGYIKYTTPHNEPCLVACARPMPTKVVSSESYASRHGVDGRCLYVEPLYGLAFGQLPQEMEGGYVNDKHAMVPGVQLKPFTNPWTKDTEFMIARYSADKE